MRYSKFIAKQKKDFSLAEIDPDFTGEYKNEDEAKQDIERDTEEMAKHQGMMTAHEKYGLLLIFQGMDAAGKDPIIRDILKAFDPQACEAKMFKAPTEKDLRHDYLWRAFQSIPARGQIGIFNRSYYEQLIADRVHPEFLEKWNFPEDTVKQDIWKRRFKEINNFEEYLHYNGIHTIKFFLHQSKEKQRERLLERIERTDKRWGFSMNDVTERDKWNEYQKYYSEAIGATSTKIAPWYVVPDEHRWFAKAVIAAVITDKLKSFHQQYPRLDDEMKKKLAEARKKLENK